MPDTALIPAPAPALPERVYRPPRPGSSLRSSLRTAVMLGGSVFIGSGVALGAFGLGAASLMAVGLATIQVVFQTGLQNRLGQDVMGGIARGDLGRALAAAEAALESSPSGSMRTLAAANLASVLMQSDRVRDGAAVLDRFRPGLLQMPLSTVLWFNNRAFAAVVLGEAEPSAAALLDQAERRMQRAGSRGFGGDHNFAKIASALAGTRAMERVAAGEPQAALQALQAARSLEDTQESAFRVVERELCRVEALAGLGRKDEAVLAWLSLQECERTPRQQARYEHLRQRLAI